MRDAGRLGLYLRRSDAGLRLSEPTFLAIFYGPSPSLQRSEVWTLVLKVVHAGAVMVYEDSKLGADTRKPQDVLWIL